VPPVRQLSFAKGEFSPTLWARTDYAGYGAGARRLRNFLATPWGAATNRPGMRYVAETRLGGAGRMLPFTFGDDDTLLLVFTDQKIRFYTVGADGLPGVVMRGLEWESRAEPYAPGEIRRYQGQEYRCLVEAAGDVPPPDAPLYQWALWGPEAPLEVDTPYTAEQLSRLRYAQVGDVITLCHPAHAPRELTRTSASPPDFSIAIVSFDVPAFPAGLAVYAELPVPTETLPEYPAKQWTLKTTAIIEDDNGNVYETAAVKVTGVRHPPYVPAQAYGLGASVYYAGANWVALTGVPANYVPGGPEVWDNLGIPSPYWSVIPGSMTLPPNLPIYASKPLKLRVDGLSGLRVLAIRIYRGRGSVSGYVGEMDYDSGGASGEKRFTDSGDEPDWSRTPPKGENPFKVYDAGGVLLRTEAPAVVAFYEQRRVFARTNERPGFIFCSALGSYSVFDEHSPALAEDTVIRELAAMTWQEIRALIPGSTLLGFTNAAEFAINGGREAAPITPTSFAARPRTERGSSWLEPLKVGDDEVLFAPPAGNLIRQLTLDGSTGKYAAPDVTLLSRHLFKRKRIVAWDWQEEPWSLLWVAFDDGSFAAMTHMPEHDVAAWAGQVTDGVIEDVCCVREGTEDAVYFIIVRTVNGAPRRYIERLDTRDVTDAVEGLFLDSALTYRGAPATHFSGLDHLEGKTVHVLADGFVVKTGAGEAPLVVTAGAIDLDPAAFPDGASVVHIGLPYVSELELLDLPSGEGRNRVKSISEVILEFEASRGTWVGQKFPAAGPLSTKGLEEWRARKVEHGYASIPLEDGSVTIPVSSDWNRGGRAVVRHIDPTPLTLLAVTREVTYGGA
jgi:hypothetical protein